MSLQPGIPSTPGHGVRWYTCFYQNPLQKTPELPDWLLSLMSIYSYKSITAGRLRQITIAGQAKQSAERENRRLNRLASSLKNQWRMTNFWLPVKCGEIILTWYHPSWIPDVFISRLFVPESEDNVLVYTIIPEWSMISSIVLSVTGDSKLTRAKSPEGFG